MVKYRHCENGLHQFLAAVTLRWIKEAREQNATSLENSLSRFRVRISLFVHFSQYDRRIKFLFCTFNHRVSTTARGDL